MITLLPEQNQDQISRVPSADYNTDAEICFLKIKFHEVSPEKCATLKYKQETKLYENHQI